MKLSEYILTLVAQGKLTKEAAEGHGGANPSQDYGQLAKGIALTMGVTKGLDLLGTGIGKLMGGLKNKDTVFQQLMMQHPSMQGKDPVRAKANFDYIVSQTPHMLGHPLLLGDQVANMTSLGSTDPSTLKTIADIGKAKSDTKTEKFFPGSELAGTSVGQLYMARSVKPNAAMDLVKRESVPLDAIRLVDKMIAVAKTPDERRELGVLRNRVNDATVK